MAIISGEKLVRVQFKSSPDMFIKDLKSPQMSIYWRKLSLFAENTVEITKIDL